jgi:hypothetical protein
VGYGRRVTHTQFWLDYLSERDHLRYVSVVDINNIRMDVKEIWCEHIDWIHLALVNTVMNLLIPKKLLTGGALLFGLSGRALLHAVNENIQHVVH